MKQLTLPQKAKILKALHYIYLPSEFTYTDYSPRIVVDDLIGYVLTREIPLKPYRPKWRWSKAVGYRNEGACIVYYNIYKESDEAALLGLVVHECLHIIGYGHGSNCMAWYCNGRKKTKSANVYLERAVREYLRRNK